MLQSGRPFLTSVWAIALVIVGGLTAATAGGHLFVRHIQMQQCYDYARHKGLAEIEFLAFTDVVIASNQFRGHICRFTDTRTGVPVSLAFDEADIPYLLDTLQVMSMVLPFLCVCIPGAALISWQLQRNQSSSEKPETV